ncbi:ethanolamine ammonia-lyase subunit EutC [Clostridium sp. D2Q-11]|uniref:Ethanolamine ammonia-lyase small subunit n=1 Tax=Anaeromonas frigoriresistens TaxID=2683708 RepID=A0A942V0J9_9FIRM|nr:ethanolamine ammonia-lyase subunit EutC [Anaeromonas frigoriresistens]MBS4537842.1 ethanolamine ammonia-lyase subunit EutC [Anaeromonas frigoriresistens]
MVSEKELREIVEQVIAELGGKSSKDMIEQVVQECTDIDNTDNSELPDITTIDLKKQLLVPNPENPEEYLSMKAKTPARVGVWRAGPRYKTETLLRFRADHAVAMDAVFTNVSEEILEEMNLFTVKTKCRDKDEYLTRPDLGRKFDDEEIKKIKDKCKLNPQVQIVVADGLSSTAIEANIKDILPVINQGLEGYGVNTGTPFFIKFGRVPSMDVVSEVTKADVTCLLVGERPGLATGESMSAYIAYKSTVGMPEARRTVVSNIHQGGTAAVEAGAHIAHVIKEMLDQKASGLDLEL